MAGLNLDVVLFYGSLGLSLAAVVLFLYLMRRNRDRNPDKPPGS